MVVIGRFLARFTIPVAAAMPELRSAVAAVMCHYLSLPKIDHGPNIRMVGHWSTRVDARAKHR